jgi:monoamine oxidase
VRLGSIFARVEQTDSRVICHLAAAEPVTGDYVVVCAPLAVTTAIGFNPPLPAEQQQLVSEVRRSGG